MTVSDIHTGWGYRKSGGRPNNVDHSFYYSGTEVARMTATVFSHLVGVTITDGGLAIRGDSRIRESMGLADNTTGSNQTYTAAQLVGGILTRDPNGSGRTDTTATGTEIETELNAQGIDVDTGDTFTCLIVNTANGAETITLAGGTGVTISNVGQTIAQYESALLLFRRTGANAFTCYILGA